MMPTPLTATSRLTWLHGDNITLLESMEVFYVGQEQFHRGLRLIPPTPSLHSFHPSKLISIHQIFPYAFFFVVLKLQQNLQSYNSTGIKV